MGKKYLDENGLAYFWSKLKQYLATTSRAGLMSPTDKAKVDAITNQGTVSYHKKYEGTFTTTGSSTSTIPIPISSYSTADILLVDINGLDLVENTDYTISGTDIVLTNPITESGQIVHFVAVRATTASVSDYALLKGDAGVVDAYPISGATPLSASWLSDTSGGSALTPEANQIYILMSDSGDYTANALFRWNGTAYVPLTSGGSVTSTSVPTANTISEFDSDAHMNSEDMTAQEVQDFVDNLEGGGGSGTADRVIEQGTDGIWTYRKWNSGVAECWGTYTLSYTSMSTWGSMYYSQPYATISFPTGLFVDIPTANFTRVRGIEGWVGNTTITKDQITNVYITRPSTAGANTTYIDVSVKGRWK